MRDANLQERCKAVVQSVEFHPNGKLLMAASFDKRLNFFHVDGVRNDLVQALYLEDLPVHTARFANGGAQVIASGRRKFFYAIDLEKQSVERVKGVQGCADASLEQFVVPPAATAPADQRACIAFLGNEGTVPLVSLRSKQRVGELRMSGSVRAAAFSPDGLHLYAAGGDGKVHLWDVRMRRCVHRFRGRRLRAEHVPGSGWPQAGRGVALGRGERVLPRWLGGSGWRRGRRCAGRRRCSAHAAARRVCSGH